MPSAPLDPVPGRLPRGTPRSESDRRLRQADRLARIFRVLQLIQSRGRYDAKALARELEVGERTVYRDLTVLELAGVPWVYEKDAKAYSLRPDFRFSSPDLTDDELVGQATATELSQFPALGLRGSKATTEKLAAGSERASRILREAGTLTDVLDLKLVDHRRHREVIRTIQWALLRRKQLVGKYRSPYEANAVKLTLHPYRLALVKQAWYLIARPDAEPEPRTYRIVRFASLRSTDDPAEIPEAFDLADYFGNAWGVYRGQPTFDVELRFHPSLADIVTETTWHRTQTVKKHGDGSTTLTFRVDGLNEIVRWVVGYAGLVTVIQPSELRNLVLTRHREAIAFNGGAAMTDTPRGSLIAIGDVHGCSAALSTLLNRVRPQSDDTVLFVGDLIDYGPDTRGVLGQILALRETVTVILLAGNHEEMLFGVLDGNTDLENWTRHGGDRTLESYGIDHPSELPGDHLTLLRSARRFFETDTHLFAHANYYPNLPLAETPAAALVWEFCDPARCGPHYSGKTVVVGHTPQLTGEILDLGFLLCLDTDASRGGWLTALDTGSGEWWQADERGRTRRGHRPPVRKAVTT